MGDFPTTFRAPSRYRASTFIGRKPAANFWHAFNFANDIGRPFNTFVTINAAYTGTPLEELSVQFRAMLERRFGPWWRRPSRKLRLEPQGQAVFAWVAENKNGHPGIHWALHVPPGRREDFERRLGAWLEALFGTVSCAESALKIVDIVNAAGLRKYLLKGVDPAYARFCKIDFEAQGVIYGKRCGVSRSLQRTARERASYTSLRFRAREWQWTGENRPRA